MNDKTSLIDLAKHSFGIHIRSYLIVSSCLIVRLIRLKIIIVKLLKLNSLKAKLLIEIFINLHGAQKCLAKLKKKKVAQSKKKHNEIYIKYCIL